MKYQKYIILKKNYGPTYHVAKTTAIDFIDLKLGNYLSSPNKTFIDYEEYRFHQYHSEFKHVDGTIAPAWVYIKDVYVMDSGDFQGWLREYHPEIHLTEWQKSIIEAIYSHGRAAGKSFLIRLLQEYEQYTQGENNVEE